MPKSALSVVPAYPLERKEILMAFLYSLVESCKTMDIKLRLALGNRVNNGARNG